MLENELPDWKILVQPTIGSIRPDLLLTSPKGANIVVEIKNASGTVHISDIAQADLYRQTAASLFGKSFAGTALLTNQHLSTRLNSVARSADIDVVGLDSKNLTKTVRDFSQYLRNKVKAPGY